MTVTTPTRSAAKRRFSALSLFEAMAAPHGVDRYLELMAPMLTVRELRAEVTDVSRSTTDTVTLTLRPTRQWQGFQAGQFVGVGVVINGVRHTRCYSPACSQYRADGRIELTLKAHPEGLVSQYLHRNARIGLVVTLSQAGGTFHLPAERPEKVLLISGGSGITPVLSMLRTLIDEGHEGDIAFLHYGCTEADVAYREDLRALVAGRDNVKLVLAYTDANTDNEDGGDLHGFFGREHLDAVAPWAADAQTFLCGPPALMRSVKALYEADGLSAQLHTEEFQPALTVVGEATGGVSFAGSKVKAANTGATLLEQAEASGLSPEFGCRMGICLSCTAVKTSGCTKDVRTGETDSDPDQPIQLCISVPVGDVAINI